MTFPASFLLAGTGIYTPGADGEAVERTAGPLETSSFMGASAAEQALAAAGWRASDVDVVIGACGIMEQPIPGTAILIQRRLGIGRSGIPAFDVNATCLSSLVAIDVALLGIAAGRWRRVLVVSADIPSAAVDAETGEMFGDGAAALAIAAAGPHEVLAHRLESYADHADLCRLEAGGTRLRPADDLDAFLAAARFRMEGPALFRATARLFPGFLKRLLADAGIAPGAIDLVVPHQASRPAIDHLKAVLDIGGDRVIDIFDTHHNQIAVSLPHALHVARATGRLQPGMTVLLIGSSAGISLGGTVIRW